jgi:hypothetical protein
VLESQTARTGGFRFFGTDFTGVNLDAARTGGFSFFRSMKMNDKQKAEEALEVGKWVGRRQALSIMAGRCSAADAQSLRELRESKKYKSLGLTWEQCCKQHAGLARSSAELIIRNLEEFGPEYFVIAQVTGISANEYRRIQARFATTR